LRLNQTKKADCSAPVGGVVNSVFPDCIDLQATRRIAFCAGKHALFALTNRAALDCADAFAASQRMATHVRVWD
jgi:hypothetical protein